jgi:hypothetical protein
MPVDINGYALSNASGLKFGASNTKIVAANYGINDPMLPAMMGSATLGGSTYKIYPFPCNDVNLNVGSPWSNTGYKFTCPMTGRYYTSFAGICGTGEGSGKGGYFSIIVNGGLWYFGYRDSGALWELYRMEMVLNLAAGDYVQWAMNIAPSPDSGTPGGAYQANHNTCTIWLVG